ncbi:MAG: acetate--CoA ligase family protein, partial [Candidatus Paceibacterota bacterium]
NKSKIGSIIFHNITKTNYKGDLFLVNPSARKIEGYPVYSHINQLPQGIKVAIVVIPAQFVLEIIEDLGKKSVKYAVIISAGFKESGSEGKAREKALAKISKIYGIKIIGPNCLGIINNDAHQYAYNGSFGLLSHHIGNISLISQSGALISSFIDRADSLKIGFNKIISLGNKLDIDEVDTIKYLEKDSKTKVISLYLEGIARPIEFIKAIKISKKPIIILKAGRSEKSKKTIQSHTGSLAGDEKIIDTLLEEAGAIIVYSLEDLFDTVQLFSRFQNVSRFGTAIVTNAGGLGVLSVDASVESNLKLAQIEPKATQQLAKLLPSAASSHNPIDILGDADAMRYRETLQVLVKEKSVGSVIVLISPQVMTPLIEIGRVIQEIAVKNSHKPILTVAVGGDKTNNLTKEIKDYPYFDTPERAVKALSNLYKYNHQLRNAKLWDEPTSYVKKSSIQDINQALNKDKSQNLLSASWDTVNIIAQELDLELPKTLNIKSNIDIKKIEKKLQYPIVLKDVNPNILHRTDSGLVQLGVSNLDEVKKFYKKHKNGQIIAQEQAHKGIEVFVGVKRNSQLGTVLLLGSGGIYAEILDDIAFASMPINKPYIVKTLKKTKIYKILNGARGAEYDINWLIDTIFQLNLLVYSIPIIQELDVNPIIVYPKGGCILDLKVIL